MLFVVLVLACGTPESQVDVPDRPGAHKSSAAVRAERRAFDGAPPVIGHENFGMECNSCHNLEGVDLADEGFAPPNPHERTLGMSAVSRCQQCHVFSVTDTQFASNSFSGLRQDLRRGARLNPLAPPTLPHRTLMRENCVACHSGPAAREEIRTDHPERTRCRQCHVPVTTRLVFEQEAS
jgi:cytochrome c-type protein NapB